MPKVVAEVVVPKPPAEVYRLAKDLEGLKPYLKDVETLKVLESEPSRTKSEWVAVAMGKRVRWIEVEEWDDEGLKNRFYSPEGDFDKYEGRWFFLPEGDGARVRLEIEYELNLPLFGGLLRKLVQKLMQENAEMFLRGLKDRAEAV